MRPGKYQPEDDKSMIPCPGFMSGAKNSAGLLLALQPLLLLPLSTVCLSILMNYMLGCFLRTRSSVGRGEPVKSRTYVTPVRPALQLQTKVFPMGSQDPPFRQGLGKQAVISASQFLPVNCERQEH